MQRFKLMPDRYFENEVFALGNLIVDPITNRITVGDESVEVQPKVMELLLCLVNNYGQTVSKEFLFKHVWPNTFVVDGALRRAVFMLRKAMGGEQGAALYVKTIPRHGYRLLAAPRRLESSAAADAAPAPTVESAYRGLRVFEPDHAAIFCGRQVEVNRVTAALDAQIEDGNAFVLLLGASGCGKSSLARAGVLPALLERAQKEGMALRSLIFRISESAADPVVYFARRLADTVGAGDEAGDELLALILETAGDAVEWILDRLAGHGGPTQRLVLVFDQLEELLTLQTVPDSSRERLISLLYFLARSGKVWIVATMRSEFFPQFMSFETLRFLKGPHSQVDLAFPRAGEIADIVRVPAKLAGFSFGADENGLPLDQLLIDEASEQPHNLPLLQFALHELELHASPDRVLSYDYFQEIGRIGGCLSMHAERSFAALDEAARAALPLVLNRLVIADPRNAGRMLKRSAALVEFDGNEGARALIDAFVDARLITSFMDRSTGVPSIQLVHEAVLRHWHRASNWAQLNYAAIRFRAWLSELAERWNDDGRARHHLLRDGKTLLEAQRLVDAEKAQSTLVADFVTQSVRRARRGELVRTATIGALVGLSVIAIALWQLASLSSNRAERATRSAQATTAFLVSMFKDANPGLSGNRDMTVEELLDRARSTIDGDIEQDTETRAALLAALGETYVLIGNYQVADELLSSAEDTLPYLERNNPAAAVRVLLELGGLRKNQGRFEESAEYLDRALQKALQQNDTDLVAQILNVRGLLETRQQDYAGAVMTFRQVNELLDEDAIDSDDTTRLRANVHNNASMALVLLGDLDAADQALQRAISLRRENGLDNTAEHADTLANLGSLLRRQGRNADAVPLYGQAIDLRTALHGPTHPRNAIYLVNLVSAQLALGLAGRAADNAERGLTVVEANAGTDPVAAALLRAKLMIAMWLARRPPSPEMLDAAQASLPTLAATYGNDHAVVAETHAAILGAQLDAHADGAGACGDLGRLQAQIDSIEGVNVFVRERLLAYTSAGSTCGVAGGT